jgi:hypothetical protein
MKLVTEIIHKDFPFFQWNAIVLQYTFSPDTRYIERLAPNLYKFTIIAEYC